MPHRVNTVKNLPDDAKRRLLIGLTAVSVILIIILWAVYFNWTVKPPLYGALPEPGVGDIFKAGVSAVGVTIEKGVINSYLYAHAAFSQGRTFIIEK